MEKRHDYKIIFESNPASPPEEFADTERDVDENIGIPVALEKKTHTSPKYNLKLAKVLKKSYRKIGRYDRSK